MHGYVRVDVYYSICSVITHVRSILCVHMLRNVYYILRDVYYMLRDMLRVRCICAALCSICAACHCVRCGYVYRRLYAARYIL